ncbi:MAG: restriction endonuclease subunit S [Herpetosiphonaceae bacterium]|nr:restriction endonuclease subunit S [Herpetosiphonaceae bacterium]
MNWSANLVPLGELGKIVSGSTPDSHVKEYWGGTIPWITPADLTNHEGIYFQGKLRQITKEGYDSCSTQLLPAGSILFSSRAPIGHCAVTTFVLCTNQGFKSIIPNDKLDSVYGYFALKAATPHIVALGRGATFAEINKEIFESVSIPLPPLPEQQRIAAILAKADRLRWLRRYALDISDTYLQSVFLEMFGDPATNPRGWKISSLGKHLAFITSGSRGWSQYCGSFGTRFIQSFDVQMNSIAEDHLTFVNPPLTAEAQRTQVQPGDVLLTITGSRIGRVAPVPTSLGQAYVSQHVAILRLNGSLCPSFVSMFLSHERGGQKQIGALQYGQVKPGLNFDQIRSFEIPLPPHALQTRFAGIMQKHRRLHNQQKEVVRQAEHLFQTLLHRAFRGELSAVGR